MSTEEFWKCVEDARENAKDHGWNDTYCGRGIDQRLFGSTDLFHSLFCYINDMDARMFARYRVAVEGWPLERVIGMYRRFIDKGAPALAAFENNNSA